jgi:hypothetical protein
MTNKQESKYSMELAVRDFFNKNAAVTTTLPNFSALFTLYNNNLNQVQVIREQQEANKTGISDNKEMLRKDLIAKAYDVSKKTEVYAKLNNNAILAKEIHYSESDLLRAPDSKLKDKSMLIYDRANSNINVLGPYGISATTLTALKAAIDAFNTAIPSTRIGKTESKSATTQLTKIFAANDELIKKFDLLVEIVRLTQPVFYSGYKDNRKIIDTGVGMLALIARVYDANSGQFIKGAKATFIPLNGTANASMFKTTKQLVKVSGNKGIFKIKNLPDGTYEVHVVKTGYKPLTIITSVASGDRTVLEIKLEKNTEVLVEE